MESSCYRGTVTDKFPAEINCFGSPSPTDFHLTDIVEVRLRLLNTHKPLRLHIAFILWINSLPILSFSKLIKQKRPDIGWRLSYLQDFHILIMSFGNHFNKN